MAKVTSPLMSLDASGAFAGAMVFTKWKGRAVCRQLVTPSNPNSAGQETARNAMRAAGSAQKFVNANAQIHPELTLADKAEIQAKTPGGFAWNGYLVDMLIGNGAANIVAAQAIFDGLAGVDQTAWDTAADGLTAPILSVIQTVAGGTLGTALSSGNVFLIYEYALYVMGLVNIPDATPPAYV